MLTLVPSYILFAAAVPVNLLKIGFKRNYDWQFPKDNYPCQHSSSKLTQESAYPLYTWDLVNMSWFSDPVLIADCCCYDSMVMSAIVAVVQASAYRELPKTCLWAFDRKICTFEAPHELMSSFGHRGKKRSNFPRHFQPSKIGTQHNSHILNRMKLHTGTRNQDLVRKNQI